MPVTQGFASSTAASVRENRARASRDRKVPELVSSSYWWVDSLVSEALDLGVAGGRATQTTHCPYHSLGLLHQGCPGAHRGGLEGGRGNLVWNQVTA